jgi:DNA-binding FadR family transcriptional regulator
VKAFSIVQNQVNAVTPHRRILSAIAARSPEQASEAIAVHLTISKSDAMEAAHQSI